MTLGVQTATARRAVIQWAWARSRTSVIRAGTGIRSAPTSQPSRSSAVQVEVMGMGESSDADFPAIYADLFGERTFDNRKGGWSYEYLTSYGLPEFGG